MAGARYIPIGEQTQSVLSKIYMGQLHHGDVSLWLAARFGRLCAIRGSLPSPWSTHSHHNALPHLQVSSKDRDVLFQTDWRSTAEAPWPFHAASVGFFRIFAFCASSRIISSFRAAARAFAANRRSSFSRIMSRTSDSKKSVRRSCCTKSLLTPSTLISVQFMQSDNSGRLRYTVLHNEKGLQTVHMANLR